MSWPSVLVDQWQPTLDTVHQWTQMVGKRGSPLLRRSTPRSASWLDINVVPNELPDATPFDADEVHAAYDADAMHRFWLSLVDPHRVLSRFRAGFRGKSSPVHFFWGAFDLAVTRFCGRPAPRHPGGVIHCADWVMVEAYSEEVSTCGYWPGGAEEGSFYSYAYPRRLDSPSSRSRPRRRTSMSAWSAAPPAAASPRRAATRPAATGGPDTRSWPVSPMPRNGAGVTRTAWRCPPETDTGA